MRQRPRRIEGTLRLTPPYDILALGPDPAGATEVFVNRHRPECSWQWSTVVLAPHRGQDIAKRLKAEMWQWLRDDEPQVTSLRTGNAHSNAAMLAINDKMGFRPVHPWAPGKPPQHADRSPHREDEPLTGRRGPAGETDRLRSR